MQVQEILALHLIRNGRPPYPEHTIRIVATGLVPTTGWTNIRLQERFHIPEDLFWEFDLVADPPTEPVLEVEIQLTAEHTKLTPKTILGVRVYARNNVLQQFFPKEPTILIEDTYLLAIAKGWENGNADRTV